MAEGGGTGGTGKTPVMLDQVSALQILVAEQAQQMKEQQKAFDDFLAARKVEEAAATAMRDEIATLQGALSRLQAAPHGDGRGAARGGGAAGRGGGVFVRGVVPINAVKMDTCPTATKDQSMREWTTLATRWARIAGCAHRG